MAFYALGSGVKGVAYFSDRDSWTSPEESHAASRNKLLWEELGRINADVGILRVHLSIGCPVFPPQEDEKVWVRALMCARDHVVVMVVNKGHYIGYNTKKVHAWHAPAANVDVVTPLPRHFRRCRIQEVKDGALVPAEGRVKSGRLHLKLDEVNTARAFLISAS